MQRGSQNTNNNNPDVKYLVVTGGNISGIGKGTTASSCGAVLQSYGFTVSAVKIDPYVNPDAGTMSPSEHGECFVLGDGYEGDLDMGNYERFLGVELSRAHNITTGQVYLEVINRERRGDYLGKTVQIIPHISDHIGDRIEEASRIPVHGPDGLLHRPDIVIVELGGTVGDIESLPFIYELSSRFRGRCFFLHVALLLRNNGELKTKLVQDAVKILHQNSIIPDALCLRCDIPEGEDIPADLRTKIAKSCRIDEDHILISGKVDETYGIYEVPKLLQRQRLQELICRKFGLLWRGTLEPNFRSYLSILSHFDRVREGKLPRVVVGIVGKYTDATDAYLSLRRALEHASFRCDCDLHIEMIDAETIGVTPQRTHDILSQVDCIIIPGGFGNRGIDGKMEAIAWARQHRKPLLGICLGLQLMVIEYTRNILGLPDANSTEFNPDTNLPVIVLLEEYGEALLKQLGGTMRLGNQRLRIQPDTLAHKAYGSLTAVERHRHRYEVSPMFVKDLAYTSGECEKTSEDRVCHSDHLIISAYGDEEATQQVPEMVEYLSQPGSQSWWAVGIQSHPEYITCNDRPHPLFVALLAATMKNLNAATTEPQ